MFGKKIFRKKEDRKAKEYKIINENVAVPEVHTEEDVDVDDKVKDEHITYDNVAIPEVHIRKLKK